MDVNTSDTSTPEFDERNVWSHLFYEQELQRTTERKQRSSIERLQFVLKTILHRIIRQPSPPTTALVSQNRSIHEHGLMLDYESRIFQALNLPGGYCVSTLIPTGQRLRGRLRRAAGRGGICEGSVAGSGRIRGPGFLGRGFVVHLSLRWGCLGSGWRRRMKKT